MLIYVDLCLMSQLPCSVLIQLWSDGADTHNQYITLVKWKELIMKGVRRQRNTGRILALIVSWMMIMTLSHHYQHQNGRAFRPNNGGEHPKSSYDSSDTRSTHQFN